jgi:tRNA dimethylallyltransferase
VALLPDPTSPGRLLGLAGCTAVGKSDIALPLAQRLNGEIVSVDSMQVYRGMDIGTAKPTPEQRALVPHHLVDVVDVFTPFDAAQFVRRAREAVAQIHARGRLPILCGGTGLYFKAFFEGLGESPPADPALRASLEATPIEELLSELARLDPITFNRVDRNNPRRVIRALEIIRLTGMPCSVQRAEWSTSSGVPPGVALYGLSRANADLQHRIATRVDTMFQRGLVAETQALIEAGLGNNRTALQALGYRQVVEHLQGLRSLDHTIDLVKTRTRQFAKRQTTWFRRQMSVAWIQVPPHDSDSLVEEEILRRFTEAKNTPID